MKHRTHLICLIPAVLIAAWIVVRGQGAAGFGIALLICPIVMGGMMYMMMRETGGSSGSSRNTAPAQIDQPAPHA